MDRMRNKTNPRRVYSLAIFFGSLGLGCLLVISNINERYKQKAALNSVSSPIKKELSANNENTAGNWTIIDFNFQVGSDISSIPEILDRFEKEHPNLSIRDNPEIIYSTYNLYVYPHSILIRHDPKLR